MCLLDTMVLSDLRKRPIQSPVRNWIENHKKVGLSISAISLGEIRKGICREENYNPQFALKLIDWLRKLEHDFGRRVLSVTNKIAIAWGVISYATGNAGIDNLIAATAKVHNLIVVTRNTRHFDQTGVEYFNPWIAE